MKNSLKVNMVVNTININQFDKKFNETYDYLYKHNDNVSGYEEAVNEFDKFASEHKEFVSKYTRYRGDFISSDREAAAFMLALNDLVA